MAWVDLLSCSLGKELLLQPSHLTSSRKVAPAHGPTTLGARSATLPTSTTPLRLRRADHNNNNNNTATTNNKHNSTAAKSQPPHTVKSRTRQRDHRMATVVAGALRTTPNNKNNDNNNSSPKSWAAVVAGRADDSDNDHGHRQHQNRIHQQQQQQQRGAKKKVSASAAAKQKSEKSEAAAATAGNNDNDDDPEIIVELELDGEEEEDNDVFDTDASPSSNSHKSSSKQTSNSNGNGNGSNRGSPVASVVEEGEEDGDPSELSEDEETRMQNKPRRRRSSLLQMLFGRRDRRRSSSTSSPTPTVSSSHTGSSKSFHSAGPTVSAADAAVANAPQNVHHQVHHPHAHHSHHPHPLSQPPQSAANHVGGAGSSSNDETANGAAPKKKRRSSLLRSLVKAVTRAGSSHKGGQADEAGQDTLHEADDYAAGSDVPDEDASPAPAPLKSTGSFPALKAKSGKKSGRPSDPAVALETMAQLKEALPQHNEEEDDDPSSAEEPEPLSYDVVVASAQNGRNSPSNSHNAAKTAGAAGSALARSASGLIGSNSNATLAALSPAQPHAHNVPATAHNIALAASAMRAARFAPVVVVHQAPQQPQLQAHGRPASPRVAPKSAVVKAAAAAAAAAGTNSRAGASSPVRVTVIEPSSLMGESSTDSPSVSPTPPEESSFRERQNSIKNKIKLRPTPTELVDRHIIPAADEEIRREQLEEVACTLER